MRKSISPALTFARGTKYIFCKKPGTLALMSTVWTAAVVPVYPVPGDLALHGLNYGHIRRTDNSFGRFFPATANEERYAERQKYYERFGMALHSCLLIGRSVL